MNRRSQFAPVLLVLAATVGLALLAGARGFRSGSKSSRSQPARLATLPNLVLWAWERPEDLRVLHSHRTAVAFLAETVTLPSSTTALSVRPRLQPLRVAPETPLIAVVRIENPSQRKTQTSASGSAMSAEFRTRLATQIASLQSMANVRAIQIDFDATASQHEFYSALLQDVRRQLRPDLPLSITALASWCIGDSWLDALPPGTIDEAVPMLFRMGVDSADVANFLRANQEFRSPACRTSLGLSTDEAFSRSILTGGSSNALASRAEKRIYVFAPRPWTELEINSVLQEIHR